MAKKKPNPFAKGGKKDDKKGDAKKGGPQKCSDCGGKVEKGKCTKCGKKY